MGLVHLKRRALLSKIQTIFYVHIVLGVSFLIPRPTHLIYRDKSIWTACLVIIPPNLWKKIFIGDSYELIAQRESQTRSEGGTLYCKCGALVTLNNVPTALTQRNEMVRHANCSQDKMGFF